MSSEGFEIDPQWAERLKEPFSNSANLRDTETQCRLVFSLILYLNLSLRDFIFFLFESNLEAVRHRAGIFLGYSPNKTDPFAPARVYQAWHDNFPKCQQYLHEFLVASCAEEIVLGESDAIILDSAYRVYE